MHQSIKYYAEDRRKQMLPISMPFVDIFTTLKHSG